MEGQGLEYWGRGGGKRRSHSKQARYVVTTSMRRNDVALTSCRRHVPTRFLINLCQIITFLILKSDIIENLMIVLRSIVLPVPSNQSKVAFIIIFPSTWYLCDFCLFHIEIEGKCGWIIGMGPMGMLASLSNHWGACLPHSRPPLPTPMKQTNNNNDNN